MPDLVRAWFEREVGRPFGFQEQVWGAQLAGRSGLIHAPTGLGKTYAAWLPTLMRWCEQHPDPKAWRDCKVEPVRLLWITPLRALAADTTGSLRRPVEALNLPWSVQGRTGDTPQSVKAKQKQRLPSALVTTPESLSVLLSYADAPQRFKGLWTVVVDEWHELMGTKRGTQTELCLARLRRLNPGVQTWGLSATMGNLEEAMVTLLGAGAAEGELVSGPEQKKFELRTLLPTDVERFPWSGHLGLRLLEPVLAEVEKAESTLLFTNTRAQAELWFQAILDARPDWIGSVALHHGSIDKRKRVQIEELLRLGAEAPNGGLRCCVCTSSLDLGVDFSPVEQVVQVASPKGVARLLQRAGRSGHRPGATSVLIGVPTNALELIDFAAAREAALNKQIEARVPLERPLDVLAQHLVTCAMGGGFTRESMLEEVRGAHAYRHLSEEEFGWVLDFVQRGGESLKVYPQFQRVASDGSGRFTVSDAKIARDHRLNIGTITSNAMIQLKLGGGRSLGVVEESFVGFLKPGDRFVFGGMLLELVRVRGMTATVRKSNGKKAQVPRWQGSRSPLSTQLAHAVRRKLDDALAGDFGTPEMTAVQPLLTLQAQRSRVPASDELLIEDIRTRDGYHLFLYPVLGRLVHEGIGALLAYRLTRREPRTVVVTVNDFGLELLTPEPLTPGQNGWRELLGTHGLLDDLLACVDTGQLARRQFRDIARIAGLINPGFPGQQQSNRQTQASSELFFDVFQDFDPENLLLNQAKREVLDQQLEVARVRGALEHLDTMRVSLESPQRLTPFAFPLWAERLREQHTSSESWADRVSRMAAELEAVV